MKQCVKCGKSGMFLKLDERSLCVDCAQAIDSAAAAERQTNINKASLFIRAYGERVQQAICTKTIMPSMGTAKLERIVQECDFVMNHINDWRQYEDFQDAFDATLQKDERGREYSPLYPGHIVFSRSAGSIDKLFSDIAARAKEVRTKAVLAKANAYDFTRIFKIVGVSFRNGRRSRQTILRQIHFGDPPYNGNVSIRLQKQDYEGEEAIGVYANEEQVGFISRDDLPWLLEHWNEYSRVLEYKVYGGGEVSYGMEILAAFRQKI